MIVLLTTIGDTGNGNEDVTACTLYVGMKPVDLRENNLTQFQVMAMARKILLDYPDLRSAVQPINDIAQGGAANYQFNFAIQGPDLEKLDRTKKHPLLVMIHGGVHANFTSDSAHIVRELLDQGYSIISLSQPPGVTSMPAQLSMRVHTMPSPDSA